MEELVHAGGERRRVEARERGRWWRTGGWGSNGVGRGRKEGSCGERREEKGKEKEKEERERKEREKRERGEKKEKTEVGGSDRENEKEKEGGYKKAGGGKTKLPGGNPRVWG